MPDALIDAHVHIVASDRERYPISPLRGSPPDYVLKAPLHAEELLRRMDEAGIERALIVQAVLTHGFDNSYIVDMARDHPAKFSAVCCLNGLDSKVSDQLAFWMEERGAAGFRVVIPGQDHRGMDWLDVPDLWHQAERLKSPMCIYLGSEPRTEGLTVISKMLSRFPATTVVVDHVGNPDWAKGPPHFGLDPLLALRPFPRVFFKFSTGNLKRLAAAGVQPGDAAKAIVEIFGAQRIMWGSNMPATDGTYPEMVAQMRAALADLSPNDREWIFGRTARAVYSLGD